jgi:hypothetical protein
VDGTSPVHGGGEHRAEKLSEPLTIAGIFRKNEGSTSGVTAVYSPGGAGFCHRNFSIFVYPEMEKDDGGSMPDKSPRKPSAKKVPDRTLKEKRADKKHKQSDPNPFGGRSTSN